MTFLRERRTSSLISVLIVDDHPLFRDGLQKALELEDDIEVIGQCATGEDAVHFASKVQPTVVLLDINLPEMNGLQVARLLKAERPAIAIIFLTAYHDSQQVLHAMRAGASAYCPKDIMPDELIEVIRDVAKGFYIVGTLKMNVDEMQAWINMNVEALSGPYTVDPDELYIPLSPRELEILQFVTNGLSN
ncbi:MAG: response regulator transcription factor, partial [Anaerolineae bacterium]|nr:response regulator transcription factor [Anaerolineae bacterium]